MKVTHYSNSFISVRSQGEHIVCDPWMGKANTGGWQSFPEYPVDQLAGHLADARWIYVSHLHDDHFHPRTLQALGLLDREFIIKRFQTPILRERLKKLGVSRVVELDPFVVNQVGSFQVGIFPQMTSNYSGLVDDVNYDLDTSIAFKAGGTVFFNQVDNPLSMQDVIQVRDWIFENLGRIDIACRMSGAASEYPHLFLGIDQVGEKARIVERALNDLADWLRLLDPTFYFSAGGTYLIPGWMGSYSHSVAQPNYQEISQLINQLGLRARPLALEGGYSFDISVEQAQISTSPEVMPVQADLQAAIRMHSADPYDYEVLVAPTFDKVLEMLRLAQENWQKRVQQDALKITQSIRFEIYRALAVVDGKPDQAENLGGYRLFGSSEETTGELTIHIDQRALVGCMTRRFIWNGVLGALCLYERIPNRHFPTDVFSLNFLTLTMDQIQNFELTQVLKA